MQTTHEQLAITRELAIDASPETVWSFLVEPEKALRWMGVEVALSPEVGGAYRCEVLPGRVAIGEVVEVEPQRRLVLSWGWEQPESAKADSVPPGSSTVSFELEPDGTGTRLRFTHGDLPSAEAVANHTIGWDHYLGRLATAAGGGDPGRDVWLDS